MNAEDLWEQDLRAWGGRRAGAAGGSGKTSQKWECLPKSGKKRGGFLAISGEHWFMQEAF